MKEEGVFSIFKIVIGFYFFALFSFFILMCMDCMECFLHALRLHWYKHYIILCINNLCIFRVEFQSKFYKADGNKFKPFSFIAVLNEESSE